MHSREQAREVDPRKRQHDHRGPNRQKEGFAPGRKTRTHMEKGGIDKPGYAIGGKSGTAQVIRDGAYDDTFAELVGSYIGFIGPEEELPKYVIMVKMWGEGQSIESGIAMDLFDKLSNYMINYLKIKPKA